MGDQQQVPLGRGPPTKEELALYYPPKFTWSQLKLFINSGDLGLLKRDRVLQQRYNAWAEGVRAEYGSLVNYLLKYRIRWGEPDRLTLLPSALSLEEQQGSGSNGVLDASINSVAGAAEIAKEEQYFKADTPPNLVSIIQNDWPYSVPLDVEHALIWTRLPILPPPTLVPAHIRQTLPPSLVTHLTARLNQDGLWGFTGSSSPPPSPSRLPSSLGALSEWGITMEKVVRSERGTADEEEAVRRVGEEVGEFVKRRWTESEWETAWFVNPPRLQSVKGLAHIHVFARRKGEDEVQQWIKMSDPQASGSH